MKHRILAKVILSGLGLFIVSLANAFVGQMVVGIGEMDPEIGRVQKPFSADLTFESEEITGTSRLYYDDGKVRDEIDMGGEKSVMIRRFDTNKLYMLMPAMPGMYMEIDPDQSSDDTPEYRLISREVMGEETINGIPATKYKSVYESKDGKFGGFTWFTEDNIAVKAFMISEQKGEKQRFKYELSNLQLAPQDDALFELPPGATKFSAMGMMSGGMDMEAMQKQAAEADAQYGEQSQVAAEPAQVSTQSASSEQSDDGGFAGEVADEASGSAQDAVKDETGNAVEQSIRKGFGKLFGR